MDREQEIVAAIDRYCNETGLSPATVGFRAHRDSKIYDRLKDGGSCSPKTYEKVMDWFNNHAAVNHTRPKKTKKTRSS
jgi:predicted Rdx family selenoprotein